MSECEPDVLFCAAESVYLRYMEILQKRVKPLILVMKSFDNIIRRKGYVNEEKQHRKPIDTTLLWTTCGR